MEGKRMEEVKKIIEQSGLNQPAKEFSNNENEARVGKNKIEYVKADLYALQEKIRLAENRLTKLANEMDEYAGEHTFQAYNEKLRQLQDEIDSDIKEEKRLQAAVDGWQESQPSQLPDKETWAN